MKIKKNLTLLLILFLLTGCSANTNIYLYDDYILEDITVSDSINEYTFDSTGDVNADIRDTINMFENNYTYYDTKEYSDNNNIIKNYKYEMTYDNWNDFSTLKKCYEDAKIYDSGDKIIVKTSNEYLCGEFYNVKNVLLTINTDLNLINTNADIINNNQYMWEINESNYLNHPINLELKKNVITTKDNEDEKNMDKYLNMIIFGIIIIILIFVLIIYDKIRKSNK